MKKWSLFEKVYLASGIVINIIVAFITKSSLLAIIQSYSSIFNSILTAKGSIFCYLFAFVETFLYIYISFNNRYFSEVIVNLFVILPITIYGFLSWKKNQSKETDSIVVEDASKKEIMIVFASQIIMGFGYYYLLKAFDTSLLLVSTISMALNIAAFYFTARRAPITYVLFICNCVFKLAFWVSPLLHGDFSNATILVSSLLYFVSDIYGLYNWKRIQKQQKESAVLGE